jgi:hypothetical protein
VIFIDGKVVNLVQIEQVKLVPAQSLVLCNEAFTFQLTTYIFLKEDYYV